METGGLERLQIAAEAEDTASVQDDVPLMRLRSWAECAAQGRKGKKLQGKGKSGVHERVPR